VVFFSQARGIGGDGEEEREERESEDHVEEG
jgi:hypothetical protein